MDDVDALLERSHALGADPRVTNYGGGNTSCKTSIADPVTGAPTDVLVVKGSGGDLATLRREGRAWHEPDLAHALDVVGHDGAIVDVTDPRFLHPDDMLGEVTRAAGLPRDAAPPVVARSIVESTVPVEATALGNALVQGMALGLTPERTLTR